MAKKLIDRYKARFEIEENHASRASLAGEMNYEAGKVFYTMFIAAVMLLPFIIQDLSLHPNVGLVVSIRLAFSVLCLILIGLRFTPSFKNKPAFLLKVMTLCLYAVAAVVMATAGEHATMYIATLSLVFLLPAFMPFSMRFNAISMALAVLAFVVLAVIFGIDFSYPSVAAALFTFVIVIIISQALSIMQSISRHKAWQQRMEIKHTSERLECTLKEVVEADEKVVTLLESAPFGIEIWDSHHKLVSCNPQLLDLLGVRYEQELIDNYFDKYSPELQECGRDSSVVAKKFLDDVFEKGGASFEWIYHDANGQPLPVMTTMTRFSQQGKYMAAAYVSDLRPIMAAIELERAQEVNSQIQLIIDTSPMCIAVYDAKTNLMLDCSAESLRTFGFSDKESILQAFNADPSQFFPGHQPCGTTSVDMIEKAREAALEKGRHDSEFLHIAKGKPLYTAVTQIVTKHIDRDVIVTYIRDITTEKEIEAARKAQEDSQFVEQKLKVMLDALPLVCVVFDEEHKAMEVNQAAATMFGFDDKYDYLHRFLEINPEFQPDGMSTRKKVHVTLAEAFETGSASFEWMHCMPDQVSMIPCEVQMQRVNLGNRNVVVCFVRDVREQQVLLDMQTAEQERLQGVLDMAPFIFSLLDEDFNVIDASQKSIEIFGAPSKQHFIENVDMYFPETQPCGGDSMEISGELMRRAWEEGYGQYEWTYQTLDGRPLHVEETLQRITLGNKDVMVCFARDLTEQNKLIELQELQQERLQATLDASPLVCMLVDENHIGLSINQKAEALFAVSDKQYFLDNMLSFMPQFQPDGLSSVQKSYETLARAFIEGSARYEWTYLSLLGEPIPCEETIEIVTFGDVRYALVYTRDLREEKAVLAKLEESVAREQMANQAKTRFLARMSHEIRTPMNSVLGITELQLQKDSHPADTEEAFERIYNSSNLLLTIINDILDLSKVEAGKMEIVPAVYESASMIIDTVQLNLMYIGSKRIEFKLDVTENLPLFMLGDELRIKQILNNILSNAFKYTLEGTVTLTFGVEYIDDFGNIILVIRIIDTGQGMSEEQLASLYSDFTRFNVESNKSIEGTGLGLSIAHQLLHMMNGEIAVESRLGVGTAFTIRLPQKLHGNDIIGPKTAANMQNLEYAQRSLKQLTKMDREPMPYGRVLVVDDVESNLYVAKGFLIPYKLAVDTVESGILAIEKIKDGAVYDVIFMDYMMPEMDGLETTRRLREMGYDHPIVALTANAFSDMEEMFLDNGFSGYASKPIDINQMNKHLLKFVRDKQPLEVIEQARSAKATLAAEQVAGLSEVLINSFLKDAKKALVIIEEEQESENLSNYIIQTHAMRSALHNIGRKELAVASGKLEAAARRGDSRSIASDTPPFLFQLKSVINELEPQEDETEEEAIVLSPEEISFLHEQLRLISEACDAFEADDARDALSLLVQKTYPKQIKIALDDIYDNFLGGDLDEVASLALQLISDTM